MSYVVFPLKGKDNKYTINRGSSTNVTTVSCFSRPSNLESLKGARYMRCEFGVRVAVLDNLNVYVGINGGKIYSDATPRGSFSGWPKAFLAGSVNDFSMSPDTSSADKFILHSQGKKTTIKFDNPGDISVNDKELEALGVSPFYTNFGILCTGSKSSHSISPSFNPNHSVTTSGRKWSFPTTEQVQYDQEISEAALKKLGYVKIGSLQNAKSNAIYIGGLCLFNLDVPAGTRQISAYKITIPKLLKALKYYPASTCYKDDTTKWYGHSCQRPKGYCQVYSSLGWSDRKNKEDDKSESTVFLYNSSSGKFNTISPWIDKVSS